MGKKIFRQFLLLRGLNYFAGSFMYATLTLFFIEKGLTLAETGLLFSVYFFSLGTLEIPTGIFADSFGRKKAFVLSCVLSAGGLYLLTRFTSIEALIAVQLLRALGTTLANGSIDAWAFDRISKLGDSVKFLRSKVYSYDYLLRYSVAAVGGAVGSLIGWKYTYAHPLYVASLLQVCVAALALAIMVEVRRPHKHSLWMNVYSVMRRSYRTCKKSPVWLYIVLTSALVGIGLGASDNQWQVVFAQMIGHERHHWWIWATISIFAALGACIANRFNSFVSSYRKAILWTTVFMALGVSGVVLSPNWPLALAAYLVHDLARGIADPVRRSTLAENLHGKIRATVASSMAAVGTFSLALGAGIGSVITDIWGITAAWIIPSIIMAVGTAICYLLFSTNFQRASSK